VLFFKRQQQKTEDSWICFWKRKDMNFSLFFHQSQKNCLLESGVRFSATLSACTRKMFCLPLYIYMMIWSRNGPSKVMATIDHKFMLCDDGLSRATINNLTLKKFEVPPKLKMNVFVIFEANMRYMKIYFQIWHIKIFYIPKQNDFWWYLKYFHK